MIDNKQVVFSDQIFLRRPFFRGTAYNVGRLGDALLLNVFKNALWLSSPEFYRELEKKHFDIGLLSSKEKLTALKFFNRMSFRATPFGAFSAFALVPWTIDDHSLSMKSANMRLHLLPSLEKATELRRSKIPGSDLLLLAANPTLYQMASGWRYTRYETEKNGKLSFYSYLLEYNDADAALLASLISTARSFLSVQRYLMEITDCEEHEAQNHLERLLEEQVLLDDSGVSLLLKDQSTSIIPSLHYHEQLLLPSHLYASEDPSLSGFDGKSFYAGLEMTEITGGLDHRWQTEIRSALKALDLLAVIPPKDALEKFKKLFEQKFGEQMVPLLEALDPDIGIIYDGLQQPEEHELIQGLEFQPEHRRTDSLTWTQVHRMLMKVWLQNNKRDAYEKVTLTPENLTGLISTNIPLPPSVTVFFTLTESRLVLNSAGGVTSNAIAGRFSGFSEDFYQFCRDTAGKEAAANPEILYAEILQVSHSRVDNINRRKQIYEYVIPLNAFPSGTGVLQAADLRIGVSGGEIVLLHSPTGKRVIPRLPTAFNFHHNDMPLFRFLCDLQFQSVRAGFDFDPEKFFPGLDFYPRIEYGNVILSLAKWHLRKEDIELLLQRPFSISRLHLFCRDKGIPASIAAGRGDQQLFFNLANDDEALFFLESLHDSSSSVIVEYLGPNQGNSSNDEGFVVQYIATLFNSEQVYNPLTKQADLNQAGVQRNFPPGSEWVYLKIYCTNRSAEYLLLHVLLPWINANKQGISQWFFVRYYDPESHLRIRLMAAPDEAKNVQSELNSLLTDKHHSELVQKAYFDTYQREIERYSPELIDLVESVFHYGSELVADNLTQYEDVNEQGSLLWPVLHCYRMVNLFFGGDTEQIIRLCQHVAAAFYQEHGGEKKLKKSMDDRFREIRPGLTNLINSGEKAHQDAINEFWVVLQSLAVKCKKEKPDKTAPLIADMVHMQINRIFSSEQRRHEAFIWHCMVRLAITAREKKESLPMVLSEASVNHQFI